MSLTLRRTNGHLERPATCLDQNPCAAAEPVSVPGPLSGRALSSVRVATVSLRCCSLSPDTGSSQERQVFDKAVGKLKPNRTLGPTSSTEVERDEREPSISGVFKVNDILAVGKEVNLALMLKNLTRDTKTVTVNMTAWTIVYNGTLVHEVWKDSVTISLDPEEGNSSCRL